MDVYSGFLNKKQKFTDDFCAGCNELDYLIIVLKNRGTGSNLVRRGQSFRKYTFILRQKLQEEEN